VVTGALHATVNAATLISAAHPNITFVTRIEIVPTLRYEPLHFGLCDSCFDCDVAQRMSKPSFAGKRIKTSRIRHVPDSLNCRRRDKPLHAFVEQKDIDKVYKDVRVLYVRQRTDCAP